MKKLLVVMLGCALVYNVNAARDNEKDYYKTKIVHPDWTLIGKTNKLPRRNNYIKLISITEWK